MSEYTKICKDKNDYKAECTLKVVMHDIKLYKTAAWNEKNFFYNFQRGRLRKKFASKSGGIAVVIVIGRINYFLDMNSWDRNIVGFGKVFTEMEPEGRAMTEDLFLDSSIYLSDDIRSYIETGKAKSYEVVHFCSESNQQVFQFRRAFPGVTFWSKPIPMMQHQTFQVFGTVKKIFQ